MEKHKIKQVTILNQDSEELENYFPKEEITIPIEEYRKSVFDKHFPEIQNRFPEIKKNDITVLLTHVKLP